MTKIVEIPRPEGGYWWGEPDLQDFAHRVPYIYLPGEDVLLKGEPGLYHDELKTQALDHGYHVDSSNSVQGSLFQHPENPDWVQHAVHSWTPAARDPEILARLGEATGIPVSQDTNAEAYLRDLEGSDPRRAPEGWALASSVMEPEDDWWKTGCPNCGHDELDVHFHGGVSCPRCGWEGEMVGDHLIGMPEVDEQMADELWPDTLPWGEDEQDFYRHAAANVATVAREAYGALKANGGFSLTLSGQPPRPGYYVAEDHTRMSQITSVTPLALQTYMEQYEPVVRANPGMFFGGWVSGNGDVYLETSWAFDYLDQALEMAEKNHEIAIWDGFGNRELRVSDLLAERALDEQEAA